MTKIQHEYLTQHACILHIPEMHGKRMDDTNKFGGKYYNVKVRMRNLMHLRLFSAIQKVINRIVLYYFRLMFLIWTTFSLGYVGWKYGIDSTYTGFLIGMIIVVLYMVIIEKLEAIE